MQAAANGSLEPKAADTAGRAVDRFGRNADLRGGRVERTVEFESGRWPSLGLRESHPGFAGTDTLEQLVKEVYNVPSRGVKLPFFPPAAWHMDN